MDALVRKLAIDNAFGGLVDHARAGIAFEVVHDADSFTDVLEVSLKALTEVAGVATSLLQDTEQRCVFLQSTSSARAEVIRRV